MLIFRYRPASLLLLLLPRRPALLFPSTPRRRRLPFARERERPGREARLSLPPPTLSPRPRDGERAKRPWGGPEGAAGCGWIRGGANLALFHFGGILLNFIEIVLFFAFYGKVVDMCGCPGRVVVMMSFTTKLSSGTSGFKLIVGK